MTRKNNFADSFWGPDFCGTAGFDALVKKNKDGRHMLRDYEIFLRARAKVEEDYSKALSTVAKKAEGKSEIGTLRKSWDSMKEHTEMMAQEHFEAKEAMCEAADRVHQFMDQQKEQQKKEEKLVVDCANRKKDLFKKVTDTKKTYMSKSHEAEMLESTLQQTKIAGIQNVATKEYDKMVQKSAKARQDSNKADTTYHQNIDLLEDARVLWERHMTDLCMSFEKLEEQRFHFLRNELWVLTNITSQTCVDNDLHCEEVRKGLEQCDVDQDIMLFIHERRTGTDKPASIRYEAYLSFGSNPPAPTETHRHSGSGGGVGSLGGEVVSRGFGVVSAQSRPAQPLPPGMARPIRPPPVPGHKDFT